MQDLTVLHYYHVWLPQTQTWLYNQVAELERMGVRTHVVCEWTQNLDQFDVANIHCLANEPEWQRALDIGLRKLRFRRHLDYVVQVGRETGAQIVHSHFGNMAWANLGAVRKLGVKHVVTFYGLDVNQLPQSPVWRERYPELFDEVGLVLCEGTHMAHCILALGCPQEKIHVQHLGVDVERLKFEPRQWHPGEPLKVFVAASFREKKGIPYAIEALGLLRGDVPLELTIMGDAGADAASQREKSKIHQALDRTGLRAVTRLLGYRPYSVMLQQAYGHHLFLQPSVTASDGDTEGGAPVSIIDMLATGMPVVSTTHCDIPEVMGDALRHLLAPERNADALARIIRLLIETPESWRGIAVQGRERVAVEYDLRIQARRQLQLYEQIDSGSQRA